MTLLNVVCSFVFFFLQTLFVLSVPRLDKTSCEIDDNLDKMCVCVWCAVASRVKHKGVVCLFVVSFKQNHTGLVLFLLSYLWNVFFLWKTSVGVLGSCWEVHKKVEAIMTWALKKWVHFRFVLAARQKTKVTNSAFKKPQKVTCFIIFFQMVLWWTLIQCGLKNAIKLNHIHLIHLYFKC